MILSKTKCLLVIVCIGWCSLASGCANQRLITPKGPYPPVRKQNHPLIMAHFMTWYTTKPVSGDWAYFWTMNSRNPEVMDAAGRREIASHYYPLTGPYDLSDPDILEYQVLLMKLAGIDGIIVNWAGTIQDGILALHPDTRTLTRSTENARNIIEYAKRAGLRFGLNFEDRAAPRIAEIPILGGHAQALALTQQMLRFAEDQWLTDPSYVTINNRPIFTFFGPLYFTDRKDFDALFSGLKSNPLVLTVHPLFRDIRQFYWLPVGPEGYGTVSLQALEAHMDQFQKSSSGGEYVIAGATPGFHDYWREGGGNDVSFGSIPYNNGDTLRGTLEKALESSPNIIQVITWNDYIEGTMIEPTVEFGNSFLEIIQEFRKTHMDQAFSYSAEDLRIPLRIYRLRNNYKNDLRIQTLLDKAFALIARDDIRAAVDILNAIEPLPPTPSG
jgi:hypothetical protein